MSGFAFLQAEGQRGTLIDHVGACERILKTPLARVYSIKIRQFIVLFLVPLNFALLYKFESNWLVPPFLMLVAYPVSAVDPIGSELQNPFSPRNLGHLPLEDICGTIEANLLGLLAEEADAEAEGEAGTPGLDRETGDEVGRGPSR
jgi:putative membrane protein